MTYLYIIVAPSAVGKSELLNKMSKELLSNTNYWIRVPKYSTRDCRGIDPNSGFPDDVIDIDNSTGDLKKTKQELEKVRIKNRDEGKEEIELKELKEKMFLLRFNYLKEHCENFGQKKKGVVYFLNNNFYGVNISEIVSILNENNAALIMSDFRAIQELRTHFFLANRIKVVYIASSMDEKQLLKRYKSRLSDKARNTEFKKDDIAKIENFNNIMLSACRLGYHSKIEETIPLLNEQWNGMLEYYATIRSRAAKIRALYTKYIDNISHVDHVVLNFYSLEYMFEQMRNIIISNNISGNFDKRKNMSPLFMVCAATSSGKGTLMEIVGDLGKVDGCIVQVKKYAKRKKDIEHDRRDAMIAIEEDGDFKDYIKRNDIWSWFGHKETLNDIGEYDNAILNYTSNNLLPCKNNTKKREYAVDLSEIRSNIKEGKPQIFIANFDEIKNAIKHFPENIVILYLHATHQSATDKHIYEKRKSGLLQEIIKTKSNDISIKNSDTLSDNEIKIMAEQMLLEGKYQKELQNRINADKEEILAIHKKYLLFNTKVDHVLLNTGTQEDLVEQMLNIINLYKNQQNQ